MTVGLFAQLLLNGLGLGMLYVLVVLGMDLILRGTKILNFAHGQIYMLGAYVFYFTYGILKLGFPVSLALSALAASILGALCYVSLFSSVHRQVRTANAGFSYRLLMSAMTSVGLMLILQQGTLLTFGAEERGVPPAFPQMIILGDVRLPLERLVMIVVSLLICFSLYLFMFKTRLGKAMRAVSYDAEVSSLLGINSFYIYLVCFAAGCALAAFAGGIVASVFSVTPDMGHAVIFMALIVMVVGGIGSYKGAIIGGIMVGLLLSFGYQFLGGLAQMLLFVVTMIVLVLRPGGLLGEVLD